jgi:PEP-CTERM motif
MKRNSFLNRGRRVAHVAALALLGLATLPRTAHAQTPLLDFTGGTPRTADGDFTMGMQFKLTTTVLVTELGYFDTLSDGLISAHDVGLWTLDGTLLASTTIAAGLSGTAVPAAAGLGAFRFNTIGAVVLTPGDYVLGASTRFGDGDFYVVRATPTMAPGSLYSASVFGAVPGAGGALTYPGFVTPDTLMGGNLRFVAVSSAPEPGTLALVALGIVGGVVARRRRK